MRRSGIIRMSTNTATDAISGPGVYLTSLPPWTNLQYLAQSNWDGVAGNAMRQNKLDYCISIRSDYLPKVRKSKGKSWYVRDQIDLRKVPHRVYERQYSSSGKANRLDSVRSMLTVCYLIDVNGMCV
jgi:hypothetical protein